MNDLIYGINDNPKTIKEWLLYAAQQAMSVFVATVLIANICGTPISSCLFGACVGTLIYQLFTGFKSPMFISSCGATCSAVIGALAIGDGNNDYSMFDVVGLSIGINLEDTEKADLNFYSIFEALDYLLENK